MDLREDKGWTYGAQSGVIAGKFGGYYYAQTGVRTSSTDSAAMEIVKDIRSYARDGITEPELQFTKNSIGQSDARRYETNEQKAAFLSRIQEYNLGPDFVSKQNAILNGLTKPEVDAIAKRYLDPDRMILLIVGDKGRFLPGLQKSGYALVELDADG